MSYRIFVGDLRIGTEEKNAILAVLENGRISESKKVKEFENRFADYITRKYCVAVNSGTSALIAGLYALLYDERFPLVKKGAKVITTPITYIATTNAIVHAGLEPVFADVNLEDYNIDCRQIENLLQNAAEGEYCMILPVHVMGLPCDMEWINAIAEKHRLVVFEDAAQAHGTLYKGKKAGSLSLLADFSFYIAHNIQAGEMGAVVTDDVILYRMLKRIKANGRLCDCAVCTRMDGYCRHEDKQMDSDRDPRFLHDLIGFNFKTMEFPAAIGVEQLKKSAEIILRRQENVKLLNSRLEKYGYAFQLPPLSTDYSYLAYPMLIKDKTGIKRKVLRAFLESKGIESRPLFGCIATQQPAYAYLAEAYRGRLINAEYVGENGFYIGCHQYLSEEDIQYVGDVFDAFMEE